MLKLEEWKITCDVYGKFTWLLSSISPNGDVEEELVEENEWLLDVCS